MGELVIGRDWNKKYDKIKVYKQPKSSYIRIRDSNYDDYIFNLKDGLIEEGFYRYRWNKGSTSGLGSRCLHWSEGDENREYRFYGDQQSEYIEYIDYIFGGREEHSHIYGFLESEDIKDHNQINIRWRARAKYRFNPETLAWKKTSYRYLD